MMLPDCGLKSVLVFVGISLLGMCLEAWMGKTEKIKSGSILELFFNILMDAIKKLLRKGQ